jgi:hypothetical protein
MMKRFPTPEELREMDARWGINRSLDPTEFALRLDRHVRLLTEMAADDVTQLRPELLVPISRISIFLQPWIRKILEALLRRRVDHRTLDTAQRDIFNQALQAAFADGSYQAMAVIHSQNHMMHSMMGATGTQRFLPWHREYVFNLEDLLRQKQPSVTVPYWDYANDHARPDWVWQPPGVVRNAPGPPGTSLPTQSTIDSILLNASYTAFTYSLETQAHNGVHNWCNGTVSSPPTASQDPIFWLLHANVDRIWDKWQLSNSGVPTLSGSDAQLDPWWPPTTASDVNDIIDLEYSYG